MNDSDVNYEYRDTHMELEIFPHGSYMSMRDMVSNYHGNFEMIYVQSGALLLYLNDRSFVLSEGEAVVINSGTLHSGKIISDDTRYFAVLYGIDNLCLKNERADIYGAIKSGRLRFGESVINTAEHGEIIAIINEIIALSDSNAEHVSDAECVETEAVCLFLRLAVELKRAGFICANDTEGRQGSDSDLDIFREFIDFINCNYSKKLLGAEIASALFISESKLNKVSRKISGASTLQNIINLRLKIAAYKLIHTENTVADVAMDCGFNSVSRFIKAFRGQYGVNPGMYRAKYTEKDNLLT